MAENTPQNSGNKLTLSKPMSEELKRRLRQMGRWRPLPRSRSSLGASSVLSDKEYDQKDAGTPQQLSAGKRPIEHVGELRTPPVQTPEIKRRSFHKVSPCNTGASGEVTAAKQRVEELRETVRRLKLAKALGKSATIEDLNADITMWRSACQSALTYLHELVTANGTHNCNLTEMIAKLGIEPKLVHFDTENDAFD